MAPDLDTPDGIYHHLGKALAAAVDGPWSRIRLTIDVVDGSIGLTGDYTPAGTELAPDLDVRRLDHSVSKAVRNLHRLAASGPSAWSRATFVLSPDGSFALSQEA